MKAGEGAVGVSTKAEEGTPRVGESDMENHGAPWKALGGQGRTT